MILYKLVTHVDGSLEMLLIQSLTKLQKLRVHGSNLVLEYGCLELFLNNFTGISLHLLFLFDKPKISLLISLLTQIGIIPAIDRCGHRFGLKECDAGYLLIFIHVINCKRWSHQC